MKAAPAATAAASEASGSFSRISTPTAIDLAARTSSCAITAIAAIVSRCRLDAVRPVVLVLDEHAVEAAALERLEIGERVLDQRRHPGAPGVAGQRREVDDPDQRRGRAERALDARCHRARVRSVRQISRSGGFGLGSRIPYRGRRVVRDRAGRLDREVREDPVEPAGDRTRSARRAS